MRAAVVAVLTQTMLPVRVVLAVAEMAVWPLVVALRSQILGVVAVETALPAARFMQVATAVPAS